MQKQAGIIVAGLSALLLLGAGCSQQTAQVTPQTNEVAVTQQQDTTPIKIGWLGPLTGDVSSVGTADKQAGEIAVKEINDAGGINGRPLEVVYEDGFCDSKTASNAGNKLINIDKVVAIIGGFCSGETLAVAPTAEQNKVVMISPASTAPSISTAGDYIFRDVPSDSYQGKHAANFVYNTLGKRKAAVLYASVDYTQGLADVFSDEY
jgi:branched-chain amino acid transport system substrate-binding protein